ncbi:MAG: transketolase family protein [Patescibacteria group bacterium]|jgi:transketolase
MIEINNAPTKSIRDGYGEGLLKMAKASPQVVVLVADLAESTRVADVFSSRPAQFLECGISEQNMLGVAAGLAMVGKIPFVNSFAVFNPGRNWDQLRVSVCYQNLNVKVVGHHAGFSAGKDGATHQALEDIALTRVLPGLVVLSPCDFNEASNCVVAAAKHQGPVYIRISKSSAPEITSKNEEFIIGRGEIMCEGKHLTLITTGSLTVPALAAVKDLKGELSVEVVKLSTIKPLDEETILSSAKKTGRVLVVEDHQVLGGLGGAVAELLSEKLPVYVFRHGIFDCFGESGSEVELLRKFKLDTMGIKEKIRQVVKINYSL